MSAKGKGKLRDIVDLVERPAFQPHVGAKKLVIKNLKGAPRGARIEEYYQATWRDIETALESIFDGRRLTLPYERLYRGVEDICRHGQADKLAKLVKTKCDRYLNETVRGKIADGGKGSNADMLAAVYRHWKAWSEQTALIRSTFSYLDQTYLLQRTPMEQLNDMAINLFRNMLFKAAARTPSEDTTPGAKLIVGMCEMVDFDRKGDNRFQPSLFKDCVRMTYVFGIYDRKFEPQLITDSRSFFREYGQHWSAKMLEDYISACKTLINTEVSRCDAYNLDSSTKKQLLNLVHVVLIDEYTDKLLDEGSVARLLGENNIFSLKALFDMLTMSDIQKTLKEPWWQYILNTGTTIISDTGRGDEMVLRLLQLRRKLEIILRDAFRRDSDFRNAMNDAFVKFMNDRKTAGSWSSGTSKVGEMVAKYIDMLLRGGLKTLPADMLTDLTDRAAAERSGQASTGDEDAELDRQLNNSLELFKLIEGKDAFEAFYKKDLARRLLMGRSASKDAEESMLAKLRGECGANFTHNLEQMFKDQDVAKEEMENYKEWWRATSEGRPAVDLDVKVLSSAAWPTYPDLKMALPDNVASQSEKFETYYRAKHSGRLLHWKHGLATCILTANFPRGKKDLCVSGQQAVVLLAFSDAADGAFLSFDSISQVTGLTGDELSRTLQSLACAKVRPLTKHPKGRDVAKTDTFTLNRNFSDPKYRIKINQIQLKETKEENKATHERIRQDRRFETQAAIVRIMKSRKSMTHVELVTEVINLTKKRGSVDAAAIKKEIETLIEKEYLEREGNVYEYLA